jgi:hypothetical protein
MLTYYDQFDPRMSSPNTGRLWWFYHLGDAAQRTVPHHGGFVGVWLRAVNVRLPVVD